MRKREVYRMLHRDWQGGSPLRGWLRKINLLIADMIYCWIEDEEDAVGAAQIALLLSWFYGVRIDARNVLAVWKLIRDGKFDADTSVAVALRSKNVRDKLKGGGAKGEINQRTNGESDSVDAV